MLTSNIEPFLKSGVMRELLRQSRKFSRSSNIMISFIEEKANELLSQAQSIAAIFIGRGDGCSVVICYNIWNNFVSVISLHRYVVVFPVTYYMINQSR